MLSRSNLVIVLQPQRGKGPPMKVRAFVPLLSCWFLAFAMTGAFAQAAKTKTPTQAPKPQKQVAGVLSGTVSGPAGPIAGATVKQRTPTSKKR